MENRPPTADPPSALRRRAATLLEARRPDEAIPLLLQAVALEPGRSEPRCLLALAYFQAGRPVEALAASEAAAAADPASGWPHRLRAVALLQLRRPAEALAAAKQAVRLVPRLAASHIVVAEAEVANRHLKKARAAAEHARSLAPENPDVHTSLALVALRSRRWLDAERHSRDALALDPENATALNNLGAALQQLGQRRAAVQYFATASRLDPRLPMYRANAIQAASRRLRVPGLVFLAYATASLVTSGAKAWAVVGFFVAAGVLARFLRGDVRDLWRLPWERWRRRGSWGADPKASPELMRVLRERGQQPSAVRDLQPLPRETKVIVYGLAGFLALVAAGLLVEGVADGRAGEIVVGVCFAGLAWLMVWTARRPGRRSPGRH